MPNFHSDAILSQMRDTMEVMRSEMERTVILQQQRLQASPVRPGGSPRAHGGPRARNAKEKMPSQSLPGIESSGSPQRKLRAPVARDKSGRMQVSMKGMPRVALLVKDDDETRAMLRRQAAAADAEYRRSVVKYKQCRSTVFLPTGFVPSDHSQYPPNTSLELEFIHGYSGKTPAQKSQTNNIFTLASGELVFPASATVVCYSKALHRQRFFHGHDDDVTCLAVHQNGSIVASGQVGRKPQICIWDAGVAQGSSMAIGGESASIQHIGNLLLHERKVAALAFSHDGQLLASVGGDDYHTIGIWDWQNGALLATARGHNADVFGIYFNPFQSQSINDAQDLDEITYTLVSCGRRHIKFWSLYRVDPKVSVTGDSRDMAVRDKKRSSNRRGSHANKSWRLDGSAGSFGAQGQLQDITSICFLPSGRTISGTWSGDLYIWDQPRDMAVEVKYTNAGEEILPLRWEASGSLVGIIPRAHDGPVLTTAYDYASNTLATAGSDGVIVIWNVGFSNENKLQHNILKTIELNPQQTGGGEPCSLTWQSPFGQNETLIMGFTSNSVVEIRVDASELTLLITAHSGVTEALAVHPEKPYYVTAGRERYIRVWDCATRALLCRGKLHAPATCVDWSPDGNTLAVGTAAGDFAILRVGDDGGATTGLESVLVKQTLRAQRSLQGTSKLGKKNMSPMERKMRHTREAGGPKRLGKPFKSSKRFRT